MFDKILIANRGEIACRVIQTARQMGVATVAIYSDADAHALHVMQADEAVRLGPAPVADSYLRSDLIIDAARATGAQAIHPGYGFLSENPDFVRDVAAAGLVFIGPSESAIRAMGLKDAAKALMAEAGVPVVPGYHGPDQNPGFLADEAEKIGYPVLIKAVAGGGGKGMRLVGEASEFAENLEAAQAEARAAFGNAAVLIEKFVASPRHIEVQIFGDGTNAVHLFERDCSLQRRHQKVIEEAPAPGMTDDMRTAMGRAAVRAAEAIGYAGAGTVEFIVDGSDGLRPDGFWFMEMNTRLQVEHPVTEAITGVDLVEWQLRVAAGEALPQSQQDLSINGHAFEARLYAEDVPAGFLPATGRLAHLVFPKDARIDSGVRAGDDISPWYDPMIAKLTVHGPDRAQALGRLSRALAETEFAGTVTNLAFLRALAAHEGFAAGDVDTGLIGRDLEALTAAGAPVLWDYAAAVLEMTGPDSARPAHTGFTLWHPLTQTIQLLREEEPVSVHLTAHSATVVELTVGETSVRCHRQAGRWICDGKPLAKAVRHGDRITVLGPVSHTFAVPDPLDRGSTSVSADAVMAPMPGLVRSVVVSAGQAVQEGERMLVLEAMKMEHVLRAPRDGVVANVSAAEGDQVTAGAPMIALEPLA